jgi:muramoyltetrapeptide carboxypeptidase
MSVCKPEKLQPGMTIGVIAPSSGIRDARLDAGIKLLERRGYQVVVGDHVYDQHGYLAGTDASRGADFTRMFARKDVDAVFCARGGYGAMRMVDHIDWEVVRANPKLFVGYSDITTLHLALERQCGLATIHGPMVVSHGGGLSPTAEDCFWRMVECAEPFGQLDTGTAAVRTLVGGRAQGRLAGGCLELLTCAIGTKEMPDFSGRIVVMEDVGEKAYQVDRQLVHLTRCGLLEQAAGFVIGTVTDWDKEEKGTPAINLDDVWQDLIAPLGKPAIVGFPFGHEPNPLTIPLGCLAELDADNGLLTILEPAVQ